MNVHIDNEPLDHSISMLASMEDAVQASTVKDGEIVPFRNAIADDYIKMKDCEEMIAKGNEQRALLQKALDGWTRFTAHQERRLPGLKRRYTLARDYARAAEDEQTGDL